MDHDHTLLIGHKIANQRCHALLDNINLSEIERILLRPSGLASEFGFMNLIDYMSHWDETCTKILDRIGTLYDWVSEGGSLIIVAENDLVFRFTSNVDFSFNEAFFPSSTTLDYKSGKSIQLTPSNEVQSVIASCLEKLSYECIVSVPNSVPFLAVKRRNASADAFVGAWLQHGKGRIIFTPPPADGIAFYYYCALWDFAEAIRPPVCGLTGLQLLELLLSSEEGSESKEKIANLLIGTNGICEVASWKPLVPKQSD